MAYNSTDSHGRGPADTAICFPEGCSPDASLDWLGAPPEIRDSDCAETVDTEVLVVGAGCAGMFAACAAAEEGAKTLLIEKLGFNGNIRSSALAAIGTRKQKQAGVEINKTDIINDICRYALNQNDMQLVKVWADHSGEAIDWYTDFVESRGKCEVRLEYTMPEGITRYPMWPTGHGTRAFDGGPAEPSVGNDIITYLKSFDGCDHRLNTALKCIIMEDGRAAGAYCTNRDGRYIRINASKGVIICTGGYGSNREMFTALQPENRKSIVAVAAFPGATGDGIKACLWAGGRLDSHHSSMIFDRGAVSPDAVTDDPWNSGMPYFHMGSQPFLKVSKNGRRITNESSPYDFIVHAAANYEGHLWYEIFDDNWREDVTRFHTIGCSTLLNWKGGNHQAEGLDAVERDLEAFARKGMLIRADSLEELADGLGINKENFLATCARYNELCDLGCDEDFGKDTFRLSAIRTPPFYGIRLGGILLCTMDGVQIDTNGQVIGRDDKPIEGLFCIGNDSGRYYASTYPNFAAGTNAGRCAAFGRVCGRYVAKL